MITWPTCQRPPTKRDGRDHRDRQRYACRPCHRDFTAGSSSIFAGYRWPAEVILAGVRWYLSYPLSARQVTELLAERGIDVSRRTVLTWVQSFAPQLALAARPHRRRMGRRWYVDEVFMFPGTEKRYLYRAVDQHGQVIDVLLCEHRNLAAAEAFFRRALATSALVPTTIVSDHHQPYVKAVKRTAPRARHIRTGLHRQRGETTKIIERSHVAIRDRLRSSRGLKTVTTGQLFLDGFEVMHALRHDNDQPRSGEPTSSRLSADRLTVAFTRPTRSSRRPGRPFAAGSCAVRP
jgi:transposase-like protein